MELPCVDPVMKRSQEKKKPMKRCSLGQLEKTKIGRQVMRKISKAKPRRRRGATKRAIEESVPLLVIVDTREKSGWDFEGKLPSNIYIKKIYRDKLEAGDYTIVGYESPDDEFGVIIERKNSVEEFLRNIGKNWDVFKRELEKLSKYKVAAIIVEDDLSEAYKRFNAKAGKYGKIFNLPPDFILKRVSEIKSMYGVSVFFVSSKYNGQRLACNLFKNCIMQDKEYDVEE